MCTCRKGRLCRQYDIFGAQIGVTFKRESTYKTELGGCISAFLIFVFGGNFIFSVLNSLVHKEYEKTRQETNTPYSFAN